MDLSEAQTVRALLEEPSHKGVHVVFGRVSRYLLAAMRRHRIAEVIGDGRIFASLVAGPQCVQRC